MRLERGACRFTVMKLRMGRPPSFDDAFDEDVQFESDDDEVTEEMLTSDTEDPPPQAVAEAPDTAPEAEVGKTALVVDDSKVERTTCCSILRKIGYTAVTEACDGVEGLAKLKEKSYSVVFLDITMPEMDGLECIKQFREWEKQNRPNQRQFVCCVTGAEDKTSRQCLDMGMDDVIHKTYTVGLVQAVDQSAISHLLGFSISSQLSASPAPATAAEPSSPFAPTVAPWAAVAKKNQLVALSSATRRDASTMDADELEKACDELNFGLKDLGVVVQFLQGGGQLKGYTLKTTEDEREENRDWLVREVGLSERDALKLDRGICRWTVREFRMGRPAAFEDAFEEDSDED